MTYTSLIITLISIVSLSLGDYIQLENKDRITCITDQLKAAMYVTPPVLQKSRSSSILLDDNTRWSGWTLKHSTEVVTPSVTDKRWEDFATIHTKSVSADSVKSYGFSVYGGNLNITATDPNEVKVKKVKKIVPKIWTHHNMYPTYKNSSFQIIAEADTTVYWKVYDYKLRWTETASSTPTNILVPNSKNCLDIYMYLCSHCHLELAVLGRRFSFHGVDENVMWKWQSKRIELQSATTISFIRSTFNQSGEGQWGIDIRKCPAMINNKTIYTVDLGVDVEKDVPRVCDMATEVTSNNIFTCEPGTLGIDCDLTCKDLLGSEAPLCEKHKICSVKDKNCECAWGYEGESCDQTCGTGKWGLSCKNACKGCTTCKAVTGECTNSAQLLYASLPIMLALVVLLVRI